LVEKCPGDREKQRRKLSTLICVACDNGFKVGYFG
jgi:hypothetical protein